MRKIALAQINISPGHPSVNTAKIIQVINDAKIEGTELVVFPELAVSGKFIGNDSLRPSFWEECADCAKEIVDATSEITVIFSSLNNGENTVFMAKNKELRTLSKTDSGVVKIGDITVLPTSSPYYQGKPALRHSFLQKLAKNQNSTLIYVNCVGVQNQGKVVNIFDGSSAVYNAQGKCITQLPLFKEAICFVSLDDDCSVKPALDCFHDCSPISEIFAALQYGTKHFLSSIGIKRVVIGISGGIDSAVSAALYSSILPPKDIFLVNMPSRFNSKTTKDLALQLAKNLGCNYAVFPIEESVSLTVNQLNSTVFHRQNTVSTLTVSPLTAENLQARDRSSRILAAIAACVGGCFTCNANKAEATVGYSTMYGDGSGFFSALADLWKFQIYDLAYYMNEYVYKREIIPADTISITPSAELSSEQNVDEGRGDPLVYPYHDFLFRAFTEHKNKPSPADILQWYCDGTLEGKIGCRKGIVSELFSSPQAFISDLEHWWRLYSGIAVAKRLQAPPFLALTYCPLKNEPQNGTYFTKKYLKLKETVLS